MEKEGGTGEEGKVVIKTGGVWRKVGQVNAGDWNDESEGKGMV